LNPGTLHLPPRPWQQPYSRNGVSRMRRKGRSSTQESEALQ